MKILLSKTLVCRFEEDWFKKNDTFVSVAGREFLIVSVYKNTRFRQLLRFFGCKTKIFGYRLLSQKGEVRLKEI